MKKYIVVWLLVFALYVLFAGSTTLYTIITGFIVGVALSLATAKYFVLNEEKLSGVRRFLYLVYYFFKYMTVIEFKAHMDVVKRIFTGDIKPGIVKIPVNVNSAYSRLLVACSITNTPGTVVVDERDGYFYINWIYVTTYDPGEARKAISEEFEKYARIIFD